MDQKLLKEFLTKFCLKSERNIRVSKEDIDYLTEQLCTCYNIIYEIQRNRSLCNDEYIKLNKEYDEKKKKIDEVLNNIQKQCPHYDFYVSYHADPCGGSDSFHRCGLCEKTW